MEEKVIKTCSSIWSLFNSWRFDSVLFFRKYYSKTNTPILLKSRGFTFVEIIIVIAVIGILAAGLITILDPAGQLKGSRDSKRKSDIKQIQAALELYRADQGAYPDSTDAEFGNDIANYNSNSSFVDNPASVQVTYLQSVPKDPKSPNGHYYYCTSSACGVTNGYRIYSCLEKTNDPDRATGTPPAYLGCESGASYMFVTNP